MSLLKPAEEKAQRLKMYVFGDTGTGKTITALYFPKVAIVDTEKGTDHYGAFFKFDVIQTADPTKVNQVIDELLEDPAGHKTFVVDPFTSLYDSIVDKRLKQQRLRLGNSSYTLQPLDYKYIKGELKSLVSKMLSLDMNIICTAPSKVLYSGEKEEFMKVLGTDADGPKQLPYMFDVVLELKLEDGKRMAFAKKDRTNRLPVDTWFEFSYKSFCEYIGIKDLEREPVILRQQESISASSAVERNVTIMYKGKELKTAGISAESLEQLEIHAKTKKNEIKEKLREDYLVESVLDLKEDEAKLLLADIVATPTSN